MATLGLLTLGATVGRAQTAPSPGSPPPAASATAGPATGPADMPAAGPAVPVVIGPAPAGEGVPPGAYLVMLPPTAPGAGSTTAYYVPAPPPGATTAAPATPAAQARPAWKQYSHESGIYLSLTPGVVWQRGHLTASGFAGLLPGDSSTRGVGFAFDFALGGSISRTIVLGVQLTRYNPEVSLKTNRGTSTACGSGGNATRLGFECSLDYSYTAISLLGVYYPEPKRGLNIQAAIGFGHLSFNDLVLINVPTSAGLSSLDVKDLNGLHTMVAVGHEFFISPNWSLGPQLRLDMGRLTQSDDPKAEATFLTPSLRLAITYH